MGRACWRVVARHDLTSARPRRHRHPSTRRRRGPTGHAHLRGARIDPADNGDSLLPEPEMYVNVRVCRLRRDITRDRQRSQSLPARHRRARDRRRGGDPDPARAACRRGRATRHAPDETRRKRTGGCREREGRARARSDITIARAPNAQRGTRRCSRRSCSRCPFGSIAPNTWTPSTRTY